MKSPLPVLALLAFSTALLAFTIIRPARPASAVKPQRVATKTVFGCSPDWTTISQELDESDIPPIPGAGNWKWKISTKNDSAQFYFDQGINMYYSFHIIEAMASFKKAVRFDPDCAMLYWAQALAYGPNINDMGYAASPDALHAVDEALQHRDQANETERGLIDAMHIRYTADSADVNRKQLNEGYTAKMAALYAKYPRHADVATLYADALMLEHPWDLWFPDGRPKSWTPRIRTVLEKILSFAPLNPGANHYYIHVMEPSPFAEKALASADRLGKLTPGLSHTVHMPSHIYLRTGNYEKGITVNEKAVNSYQQTVPLYSGVTGADFLYVIHNLHMQTNHAMLSGRSAASGEAAKALVKSIPAAYLSTPGAFGNLVQYVYSTPVLVDVRFGNWQKLMSMPAPPDEMIYGNILYYFGKGMAAAHLGLLDDAKASLKQITDRAADPSLRLPFAPFSSAIEGVIVAENLLRGTIALQQQDYKTAIMAYDKAARTEEQMIYDEPRDWMLNPKHYLANAYLQAGDAQAALKTLEADLRTNQENGWALYGCWQAAKLSHQDKAAALYKARFDKAFSKADIQLTGPAF